LKYTKKSFNQIIGRFFIFDSHNNFRKDVFRKFVSALFYDRTNIVYYPLSERRYKSFLRIFFYYQFSSNGVSLAWRAISISIRKLFETAATCRNYFVDEGFIFARGLCVIFFVDALITDDEPLWEPIEWSLVQTWLFFIFIFAWIGENLITSRFGSYVGRDKRVWFAWYKSFWLIEAWYLISYGSASLFVIVPFYYEITYSIAFLVSWWDWYSRVFVFKFMSILVLLIWIGSWAIINIRWINWQKLFCIFLLITGTLCYLFFFQVYTTLFAYFTDPVWYQKTRLNDFIQLSHEPNKWGWGNAKRDHFTYHRVSTVFWFKNDGPFAGAFLMINLYFLLTSFFTILFWLTLLRKTYYLKEVHYTFAVYCLSTLKQTLYIFSLVYILIFFSFIISYWRFPLELLWITNSPSWSNHFVSVVLTYWK